MKQKQQKKKYGWLRLALFGSLCILGLALAGCGQEQTPTLSLIHILNQKRSRLFMMLRFFYPLQKKVNPLQDFAGMV